MSSYDSRESRISHAQRLVDAGQLEQALQVCRQGVTQDGADVGLWNFLAEIHTKLGQKREAIATYKKVAQILLHKGEFERATSTLKSILSTEPNDADAQLALATIYRKQGQNNRAALAYEMAAQSLLAQGKLQDSLAVGQLIVDMSPDNVARRIMLAEKYAQANLIAESVREFAAAAAYLHRVHRLDEYHRIAERLRLLESKRGAASQPPEAALAHEDVSRLIAEADSFLRLDLVDKAVEHLRAALARNPFLRGLREPLVKLYVIQRQYPQAVAELWRLLTNCPDPQEEIRFLRYILRLDSHDRAARQQLSILTGTRQVEEPDAPSEAEAAKFSVAAVDSELRQAIGSQRPPTDLAATAVIAVSDSPLDGMPTVQAVRSLSASARTAGRASLGDTSPAEILPPPSATTRPALAQIEAIAEELALSSRSFREELAEIDRCVQAANYDDALRRLRILSTCYPHNQTVRAQVSELERAQRVAEDPGDSAEREEESSLPVSSEIGAALRALRSPEVEPSKRTPTLNALLFGAHQDPVRTTLEVDATDIEEERLVATDAALSPVRVPAAAALAFQRGIALRERGEHALAISEFNKALADPTQGARTALLIGLCFRDLQQVPEAIASFMRGINRPSAHDAELSELFYELGHTYEQVNEAREAIVFFQLALGADGGFRDAAERIAAAQQRLRPA